MTPAELERELIKPFSTETWRELLPALLPGLSFFVQLHDVPLLSDTERAVAKSLKQFGTARLADGKGVGLFLIEVKPGVDLSRTHATGLKTYFVHEGTSAAKSYEVNRPVATALVTTTARTGPATNGGNLKYDAFGNLLESTTSTTGGGQTITEQVMNTYDDAPTATKWHLGRLATCTVTKTAPGSASASRSSSFAYHPATGLLTQEVIEPNGGVLRQQKDYTHDSFGNIQTSTLSTSGELSRTTATTYTPDGRFVVTTTNAKNHAETKTYDPLLGNVLTQTGPNGLTTTLQCDAIGRPIRESRRDGTDTGPSTLRASARAAWKIIWVN